MRFSGKFLIVLAIALLLFSVATPVFAQSQGLVPCGTKANPQPCTVCDLLTLGQNLEKFLIGKVVPLLGGVLFVIGGFFYLLAGADPSYASKGKSLMTTTAYGVAIILASYMLTNTILVSLAGKGNVGTWYTIKCTGVYYPETEGGNPAGGGGGGNKTCDVTGKVNKPANCPDAGKCPDCKPLKKDSSWQAAQSMADFLNNSLDPKFQAAGITYRIAEAMCPKSKHDNCTHFNGHAVDLGSSGGNLNEKLKEACQILNDLGLRGQTSTSSADRRVYVLENSSPGGPCPGVCGGSAGACGNSPIHLQY